jgi:hypothetical protein
MAAVARLLTTVDVAGRLESRRELSVSARLEAVLADGRRVLLLDDRGWSETQMTAGGGAGDDPACEVAEDIWTATTVEDVQRTARDVVGPDEPYDGRSYEEEARAHWSALAGVLRGEGVEIDAAELAALPHDVVLSERLLARMGRSPDAAG